MSSIDEILNLLYAALKENEASGNEVVYLDLTKRQLEVLTNIVEMDGYRHEKD